MEKQCSMDVAPELPMESEEYTLKDRLVTAVGILIATPLIAYALAGWDPKSPITQALGLFTIAIVGWFYYLVYARLIEKGEPSSSFYIAFFAVHIPIVGWFVLYDIIRDKQRQEWEKPMIENN